ncbi:hypothetical protein GDO86_003298 [Hymenochirus boettgeri]|uniref:Uncharacterized protein n=1 Tax=Hymenochirus boettgeri TaxID=247094 RepID=A0A8T2K4F8_9PIPI|nr:hypothetical protein GDO86_003298 [Hymenochirus boettgeri]
MIQDAVSEMTLECSNKKRTDSSGSMKGSPSKRARIQNDVLSISLTPRKSNRLQESPLRCTPVKQPENISTLQSPSQAIIQKSPKVNLQTTPSKKQNNKDTTKDRGEKNRQQAPIKHSIYRSKSEGWDDIDVIPMDASPPSQWRADACVLGAKQNSLPSCCTLSMTSVILLF